MKLTQNTQTLLQNFANIQPNILLGQQSGKLKTIAEAKNIFAVADITESFGDEVGIYDLTEFLSAITLIDDPDFEFDSKSISISSTDNKTKLKYACADASILTTPTKEIADPTYEVNLKLSVEDIAGIKRASSVLGHDTFSFVKASDSPAVVVKVHDENNKSSNAWTSDVCNIDDNSEFNFDFKITNLKTVSGSYELGLSSNLISSWVCKEVPVKYWIAIEHTSAYNG